MEDEKQGTTATVAGVAGGPQSKPPSGLKPTSSADIEREGDRPESAEQVGQKLIERVAREEEPTEADQTAALEFMLKAFNEEVPEDSYQDRLWVNVGTPRKPNKIMWVIRALERPEIRRIEESVERRREVRSGQGATADVRFQTSLRIVVEGTVVPDLKVAAAQVGLPSPLEFLEEALKKKSGLVEQLAGEIYGLSGYDQGDVTDATETRAAGN